MYIHIYTSSILNMCPSIYIYARKGEIRMQYTCINIYTYTHTNNCIYV